MIISYIDQKSDKIITRETVVCTDKNISFYKHCCCNKKIDDMFMQAEELLFCGVNSHYTTRYIPKSHGGFRRIDVPDDTLKQYMDKVKHWITEEINFLFPECVGAYVKRRSPKDAVRIHAGQYAIAKFDIKDFFGNCTIETLMFALSKIYPFCMMEEKILNTIMKACMIEYDGTYRLPQGAPTSPILSNLAMIPVDLKLSTYAYAKGYEYSRYADDMFFSMSIQANSVTFGNVCSEVLKALAATSFSINKDKTRYMKTKKGNVWMLGVSVGDKFKIGSENKQKVKAMIWTLLKDTKDGNIWTAERLYPVIGKINYYRYIEPDFVESVISKYEKKTGICYDKTVKNILHPNG